MEKETLDDSDFLNRLNNCSEKSSKLMILVQVRKVYNSFLVTVVDEFVLQFGLVLNRMLNLIGSAFVSMNIRCCFPHVGVHDDTSN